MPIPHSFIIVKGQPKALLIEKIDLVDYTSLFHNRKGTTKGSSY